MDLRVVRVGVAGNPSTGKTTVSAILAKKFGAIHVDVSSVAREAGAGRVDENGEFVLNDKLAAKAVRDRLLQKTENGFVVEGSFLWELVPSDMVDIVVVLRCDPLILAKRYEEAGYPERKVKDNVVSELIGYVSTMCYLVYGAKRLEVDVSALSPRRTVEKIIKLMDSGRGERVDWIDFASSRKELIRYLS